MPAAVPLLPPSAAAISLVSGRPASATGALVLGGSLAFLYGRATCSVAALALQGSHTASGPKSTFVVYRRRSGVEALRVSVRLWRGTKTESAQTVAVSLHSGTGTLPTPPWHTGAAGVALDGGMNGTLGLAAPSAVLPEYPRYDGFLDVRDLQPGLPAVLKITAGEIGSTEPAGIHSMSLVEVPLAAVDPVGDPTLEPGVDAAWTQGGNAIVDGSSGSPRGMGRILESLEFVRPYCPSVWQIAYPEGWSLTRSAGTLAAITETHRTRARALAETSTPQPVRFGVLYRFTDTAGGAPLVRLTATGIGGGSTETIDLPVSDTSSAWFYDEATGEIPCDGTDQVVELSVEARSNGTDLLEVGGLCIFGRAP